MDLYTSIYEEIGLQFKQDRKVKQSINSIWHQLMDEVDSSEEENSDDENNQVITNVNKGSSGMIEEVTNTLPESTTTNANNTIQMTEEAN